MEEIGVYGVVSLGPKNINTLLVQFDAHERRFWLNTPYPISKDTNACRWFQNTMRGCDACL